MADAYTDPDLLKSLCQMHSRIKGQKSTYLPMWQEIGDRLLPDSSNIIREYMPGGKRTQWMFDATAPLALKKYADAKESMICPATARWHGLQDHNEDLNKLPEVMEYYEQVTDILFKVRYSKGTNFTQQVNECFINEGAYGNASLYVDDVLGKGIRYRSLHIKEIFFAENFAGNVDLFHREFKMSVRQAYQRFDGNLPPPLMAAYARGDYFTEYTYVHCVAPNPDFKENAKGTDGLRYLSHYICWDHPWLCRTGMGYRSFPYPTARFMTVPGDVYARGPASLVLPDIKQLNEMEKVQLRQAQLAADPPVLLPEDGNLSGFNMQPGALVWGGTNSDGKPMAIPFQAGGNFQVNDEAQQKKRQVIQEAFYITLFQILVQTPEMTATEAMLRAQEKAQLLMPSMGRTQSEFMTGIVDRELEILETAGELPPKPEALLHESGGLKIDYVSPLNKAQQAEDGMAIMNTMKAGAEVAQFDPQAIKVFKSSDILRKLGKINGMPVELMYTKDEMDQIKQADAQQAQMANLLQAAPLAGAAAKDFATAQATIGQTQPSQAAPLPGGA